jgi:hypothetical protein
VAGDRGKLTSRKLLGLTRSVTRLIAKG